MNKDIREIISSFRRYFITGLITILPLWLTLFIIYIVFKWITGFAAPVLYPFLKLIFGRQANAIIQLTSFFLTLGAIWFVGVLATHIFGRRVLLGVENVIMRLPVLGELYLSVRKFFQFFTNKRAFRRVIMVEFPRKGVYSIGFITTEASGEIQEKTKNTLVNVFIPTTPNATTGFLILVSQSEVIHLDMRVDEAIRFIISGGIIMPPDKQKPQVSDNG